MQMIFKLLKYYLTFIGGTLNDVHLKYFNFFFFFFTYIYSAELRFNWFCPYNVSHWGPKQQRTHFMEQKKKKDDDICNK